jgi:hypothetical protein
MSYSGITPRKIKQRDSHHFTYSMDIIQNHFFFFNIIEANIQPDILIEFKKINKVRN